MALLLICGSGVVKRSSSDKDTRHTFIRGVGSDSSELDHVLCVCACVCEFVTCPLCVLGCVLVWFCHVACLTFFFLGHFITHGARSPVCLALHGPPDGKCLLLITHRWTARTHRRVRTVVFVCSWLYSSLSPSSVEIPPPYWHISSFQTSASLNDALQPDLGKSPQSS